MLGNDWLPVMFDVLHLIIIDLNLFNLPWDKLVSEVRPHHAATYIRQ